MAGISCRMAFALGSVSSIAIMNAPALAQTRSDIAATSQQSDTGIGEIVVTAQRREERGQDVPIAITAFSEKRIQQQNISEAQDLQASVPSLVVGANGQGSRDTQSFTLRGQGATFQASPGVVVYMNEVPLPAATTLSQQGGPGNFVDLENIQVLAGPQGTLFGRNTTGGAVLLVPRKPTNDLSGSLSLKAGNHDAREVEGIINVPIVDEKLMIRAVGAYNDRDGYTRDIVHNKDLDNVHWYSGRLGILFKPTDVIENYTMLYGAYSKNNGTGIIAKGFNIPGLQGVGFCVDPPLTPPGTSGFAVACDFYRGLINQANELGPRAVAPNVNQGQTTKTWGIENTTSLHLSDELTLRNIFSYQQFKSFYYYDGDGTVVHQNDPSNPGNPDPRDNFKQISEELQLQGSFLDKHLKLTAGAFYYDQKPVGQQSAYAYNYCPASLTNFCGPQITSVSIKNLSKALYAQATFDFGAVSPSLESLKLTGGYRYTWDKIDGSTFSYSASPMTPDAFLCSNSGETVPNDPQANCAFGATLKSRAPSWLLGLDYKLSDHVLLYAKVSRGYKAGGFNAYSVFPNTRTFQPERVTSYEAGFKADHRFGNVPVRLNASYYHLNYSNIQKATGDYNPSTNAGGARINSAKADVQGVELEATMRPIPEFEIGGNFSYTDFKYTKYQIAAGGIYPDCSGGIPAVGTIADISCIAGQYVAPYIFSVHAALDLPLPNDFADLSVFLNYSHTAAQHTEATILPPNQPGERLESFGLLNISVDLNNIRGSGLDIGFYMTNALNKLYRISNTDLHQIGGILSWATIYGEPRMYGVRLRYRFGPRS